MQTICGLFGYTRQAYYQGIRERKRKLFEDELILCLVRYHRDLMPRIGTRKLKEMINRMQVPVSRDYLFALLRDNRMLVRKQRKYTVTTNSKHWMLNYPNLIRDLVFDRPNRLWVSDITYIPITDGFSYLSLVTDAVSHKIVGYCLSGNLEAGSPITALKMALESMPRELRQGLIHHSDRGTQYCCKDYVDILRDNHIRISMTENGDPYENAIAERVNGILKTEWLNLEKFDTFEQAKARIAQVVEIYNNLRPHLSCGMMTPAQTHASNAAPVKLWKKRNHAHKVSDKNNKNCKQIPVLKTKPISQSTNGQIL